MKASSASTSSSSTASSTSSSSSSSATVSVSSAASSVGEDSSERSTSGDSCSYYRLRSNETCQQARSCYDCLNTAVVGENEGCFLSSAGFCQSMSYYDYTLDYRRSTSSGSGSTATNDFPAANTTYCEPSDAACARCSELASGIGSSSWANSSNSSSEASREFCVGTSGCVCLEICESAEWSVNVPQNCPVTNTHAPSSSNDTSTSSSGYQSMFPLYIMLQVTLLVMLMHRRKIFARIQERRARTNREDGHQGPYNNVNAISSPSNRLELAGWKSMQEELIQKEKKARGYVGLKSPAQDAAQIDDAAANDIRDSGDASGATTAINDPKGSPESCPDMAAEQQETSAEPADATSSSAQVALTVTEADDGRSRTRSMIYSI